MPLACAYLTLGGGEEKENRRSLLLGLGEVRAASPLWMQTAVGRLNNLRRGGEQPIPVPGRRRGGTALPY